MRWSLLVVLVGGATGLAAQDPVAGPARGFALGVTLDQYYLEQSRFAAVSLRGLGVGPHGWSEAVAVGHTVETRPGGVGFFVADFGVTRQGGSRAVLGLVGLGATTVFTGHSGGINIGAYLEGGFVVRLTGRIAIQLAGGRRWYLVDGEVPGLWAVRGGLLLLPPTRAP